MIKRNWKAIVFTVLALIVFAVVMWFWILKDFFFPQAEAKSYLLPEETINYDASEEVETALKKYEEGCDCARIIRDDADTEEVRFALAFQGLSDSTVNSQILDLLDKYDRKATFFVPGMLAAEDADAVQAIVKDGHDLGNNALNADLYMENMDIEEMIENVVRSHKILHTLTDTVPDLLYCNSTLYTDPICQAAKAAGYDKVVLPSSGRILNYNSFKTYKQTQEYLAKQSGDTILMIKMAGPLDMLEYEPKVNPETPAIDKQAGVETEEAIVVTEENVVQIVEWILKAMEEADYKTTMVRNCKAQSNDEYIEELLEKGEGKEAEVYKEVPTREVAVGLSFTGIPTGEDMTELLTLLTKAEAKATFFITGTEAVEYSEEIRTVIDAGFVLGNAGETGENITTKSAKEVYEEISLGERSIIGNFGVRSKYYMPLDERYSKESLQAAFVCGYSVVVPQNPTSIENGSMYRIDLSQEGFMDEVEAFLDKAAKGKFVVHDIATLVNNSKQAPEIEQAFIDNLRKENDGKKAYESEMIYTTDRGVSFLFYGVSNRPVVRDIVDQLEYRGYTGTFFITYQEMKECPDQIAMILNAGNEVGIAYTESEEYPAEFDSVVRYILTCQNYMEWKYGVSPCVFKLSYGTANDEIKEAVSATGYRLIGHEITMIQSQFEEAKTADEIFYSFADKVHLKRGCLVYFHMNFLAADKVLKADYEGETLCGNLMRRLIFDKLDTLTYVDVNNVKVPSTQYTVKNYSSLRKSGGGYGLVYGGQNKISVTNSCVGSLSAEEQFAYFDANYLGNPDVNGANMLPGFSDQEIRQLDTRGTLTNEKVLFLTFDDWGTDESINQILYVLQKYGVKGTFFVRTNNVPHNPNLLRAIAKEGHEVASHTEEHIPLSNSITLDDPDSNDPEDLLYIYNNLSDEEALALRQDIVNSYNTLHMYIGDVEVDGKMALSTNFRPPTLAVSKAGAMQVLDVGFTHIVNGDFSTHDYEAASVDELVNTLQNGIPVYNGMRRIKDGSVIVMHMSDEAQYTAEALDIMIPIWKSQGYSFARVDEYCH